MKVELEIDLKVEVHVEIKLGLKGKPLNVGKKAI